MIEGKTLVAIIIALIGIPAYIYTWYTNFHTVFAHVAYGDIYTWVDPAKTILLAIIALGSGLFFLIRSGIKTFYAWWEFIDKFKERYNKKVKEK